MQTQLKLQAMVENAELYLGILNSKLDFFEGKQDKEKLRSFILQRIEYIQKFINCTNNMASFLEVQIRRKHEESMLIKRILKQMEYELDQFISLKHLNKATLNNYKNECTNVLQCNQQYEWQKCLLQELSEITIDQQREVQEIEIQREKMQELEAQVIQQIQEKYKSYDNNVESYRMQQIDNNQNLLYSSNTKNNSNNQNISNLIDKIEYYYALMNNIVDSQQAQVALTFQKKEENIIQFLNNQAITAVNKKFFQEEQRRIDICFVIESGQSDIQNLQSILESQQNQEQAPQKDQDNPSSFSLINQIIEIGQILRTLQQNKQKANNLQQQQKKNKKEVPNVQLLRMAFIGSTIVQFTDDFETSQELANASQGVNNCLQQVLLSLEWRNPTKIVVHICDGLDEDASKCLAALQKLGINYCLMLINDKNKENYSNTMAASISKIKVDFEQGYESSLLNQQQEIAQNILSKRVPIKFLEPKFLELASNLKTNEIAQILYNLSENASDAWNAVYRKNKEIIVNQIAQQDQNQVPKPQNNLNIQFNINKMDVIKDLINQQKNKNNLNKQTTEKSLREQLINNQLVNKNINQQNQQIKQGIEDYYNKKKLQKNYYNQDQVNEEEEEKKIDGNLLKCMEEAAMNGDYFEQNEKMQQRLEQIQLFEATEQSKQEYQNYYDGMETMNNNGQNDQLQNSAYQQDNKQQNYNNKSANQYDQLYNPDNYSNKFDLLNTSQKPQQQKSNSASLNKKKQGIFQSETLVEQNMNQSNEQQSYSLKKNKYYKQQ